MFGNTNKSKDVDMIRCRKFHEPYDPRIHNECPVCANQRNQKSDKSKNQRSGFFG